MGKNNYHSLLRLYIIGFVASLILTISAYLLTVSHAVTGMAFIVLIMMLAITQLLVQLFCFLHLGQESRPRWNLIFFIATVGVILTVVIGSIWIMNHLNYNMTPKQMRTYIQSQDGI